MTKNAAINIAIDAIRHLIKETGNDLIQYAERGLSQAIITKEYLSQLETAIQVLESLKDASNPRPA